ncbi:MAG: FecR family protein [Rariglobus sp.]
MRTIALTSAALIAAPLAQAAGSFETAKITFIQKDVAVADLKVLETNAGGEVKRREASLNEQITKDNAVVTGQKSRAELEFNDGTITRLGQLSSFAFTQGTRNAQVKQGTALFVVPKGQAGTTIQAGPVTAAITGTTLLVQVINGRVLIYVYEGSVAVDGKTITSGQVISIENGTSVVNRFDVAKGIATAAVFTRFIDSPSTQAVERQIAEILQTAGVPTAVDRSGDRVDRAVLENIVETHAVPHSGYPCEGGGCCGGGWCGGGWCNGGSEPDV